MFPCVQNLLILLTPTEWRYTESETSLHSFTVDTIIQRDYYRGEDKVVSALWHHTKVGRPRRNTPKIEELNWPAVVNSSAAMRSWSFEVRPTALYLHTAARGVISAGISEAYGQSNLQHSAEEDPQKKEVTAIVKYDVVEKEPAVSLLMLMNGG